MKIVGKFSHRNGLDILESPRFSPAFKEFIETLRHLPPYRAAHPKKASRKHVIAPAAMNYWLDYQLCVKRDWDWHPLIIKADPDDPGHSSRLRSDFRKDRIEVEVQFGNVARYAYDVYKMAISMALGQADVGIQVVCTKKFAEITGGNIAYYERAKRELEKSRLTLIVPLVVIGIEPERWITSGYPPEGEAPVVTAADINAARKERGAPPVPEGGDEDESSLSVDDLVRIVARVA
ncbi:MAG: BglII/BstYI family type II restriction endonuclease [Candidatus Binatus sp.]|uniref:BglII/BstYI family type II restriction endonuclease n=1 Tax=Candidatus Binatus sp. TaxID=2811406 RepID=UPI003C72CDC2